MCKYDKHHTFIKFTYDKKMRLQNLKNNKNLWESNKKY